MHITPFILLAIASPLVAGELEDCMSATNATTYALNVGCQAEEFIRKAQQLDQLVQKTITATLNDRSGNRSKNQLQLSAQYLSNSQKQWKLYRDNWCRFQYEEMNGSGAAALLVQCQLRLTEQRRKELEQW